MRFGASSDGALKQISADMRNFVHVNNYVLKAEHTPDLDDVVVAKLRAAAGLVYLDQKDYAKVCRGGERSWLRYKVANTLRRAWGEGYAGGGGRDFSLRCSRYEAMLRVHITCFCPALRRFQSWATRIGTVYS